MTGFRRPESVLVIVHTDDLQVLLLKRTAPFEFWQSVTGSLDGEESPTDAAAREVLEETGLIPGDLLVDTATQRTFQIDPRWLDRYADGVKENLEHEFHYHLVAPVDIQLDPKEHSDWEWVSLDIAIDRVWSWTNREALEKLQSEFT